MSGFLLGWDACASRQAIGFATKHALPDTASLLCDDGEGHALLCAPTGSGKGRAFSVPTLLDHDGGVIAVDVKGELYAVTGRHRRTLGPVVVIDPFQYVSDGSGSFNPLLQTDPAAPTFVDDVYTIASLLCGDTPALTKDGPFWDNWATDVIAGLLAYAAGAEEQKHRCFGRVYELLTGNDQIHDLAVLLDTYAKHPFSQQTIGQFIDLPDTTRGGISATIAQHMRMLASPSVQRSLATNSLDPAVIQEGGAFTIYLVFPPERLHSHGALLRIYLSGLVQLIMRRRQRPAVPTLLLADEAAQIGRMPSLVAATTLGRAYGLRIAWLFQSYAQLKASYPAEHETILENCGTLLTFGRHPAYGMSKTLADAAFGDVSADAVFALGKQDAMLRMAGEATRVARKLDYLRDPMFEGRFDANPLHAVR